MESGRLGRSSNTRRRKEQGLWVEAIGLKKVKDIFVTKNSSFVVMGREPTLYAFGLNNYGQLGIGQTGDATWPEEVVGDLADKEVIDITGGEHHTVALTSDGQVFTFGKNDDG